MPNRRDVVSWGAGAVGALFVDATGGSAAPARSRLVTRLFNIRDDVSADQTAAIIANMRDAAKSASLGGFLAGRNLIAVPFPTRFEWMSMVQIDDDVAARQQDPAYQRFMRFQEQLSSLCRNAVECDLNAALPKRFADAPGVKVRHTVMFDFKPDAPLDAQARNVAAIRSMGELPMVQHYVVEHDEGSAGDPARMQWQVIGDFASLADYKAYSQAPVHLAIRDDFTAHTARVAFLDVQL
jgi:hypothetical protein